jgi:hypothetical protein
MCHTELALTCGVMGGFIAQEIVKVISQKDEPIRNYLVYDADTMCARVLDSTPK